MYQAIVFLPLLGFLVAGLGGRAIGDRNSELITTGIMAVVAVLSWVAFASVALAGAAFKVETLGLWLQSGSLSVDWALRIDTLTCVMLVVVNTVSFLVHLYSIGYMHEDPDRSRFFAYLSLFTFAMLMLATSDNLVQLFFGWEGVGLASYLLIGFWYRKPSACAAAIKAFVVNRVGDFGFALGIFLLFWATGSVAFDAIFAAAPGLSGKTIVIFGESYDLITVACLFLFMGACGKSAQFLLHTWLPDAMEGPTPVSALIHAATMVTAGVFMVARMSPLFELSSTALSVVTVVGATTAIFAATIGTVQNDIKRVIAYSTCSQLGYMFVGLGLGGYALGVFHLFTHAFFKALLFLGAGSVIHAMHHEQDMRRMGGLAKEIPFTFWMMIIGTLALTGFPLTAGFFSKDAIIEAAFASHRAGAPYAFVCVLLAVLLTSFYSWRLIFMTFMGPARWKGEGVAAHPADHAQSHADDRALADHSRVHLAIAPHDERSADVASSGDHGHGALHPHESPAVMLWPLAILAIGALFAGLAFHSRFIGAQMDGFWRGALGQGPDNTIYADLHHVPSWVAYAPVVTMLLGLLLAAFVYLWAPGTAARFVARHPILYNFLLHKWYFDEIYDFLFVRPAFRIGRFFWKIVDGRIIDGFGPNGIAAGTLDVSRWVSRLQTGYVYHYAFAMLLGAGALLSWFLVGGVR